MVNMRLDALDINQCPQDYYVPNAFKATARCNYDTTYVRTSENMLILNQIVLLLPSQEIM